MLGVYAKVQARLAQEDGQTMAEYAVVLAVIAIGIFVALGFLSGADRRRARQGHRRHLKTRKRLARTPPRTLLGPPAPAWRAVVRVLGEGRTPAAGSWQPSVCQLG